MLGLCFISLSYPEQCAGVMLLGRGFGERLPIIFHTALQYLTVPPVLPCYFKAFARNSGGVI